MFPVVEARMSIAVGARPAATRDPPAPRFVAHIVEALCAAAIRADAPAIARHLRVGELNDLVLIAAPQTFFALEDQHCIVTGFQSRLAASMLFSIEP